MSESNAIVKPQSIAAYFEAQKLKEKLVTAIPNAMKAERLLRLALTMINGSPSLQRCTPLSLLACVLEAGQLGLELDKVLGHAYMVPFQGEASLIIGYRGFCHLMYQSGIVASISAEVVRPRDRLTRTLGTERTLFHDPAPLPKDDDPETWVGAYAVAVMLTGVKEFEYMEAQKIMANRNRSRSWQAWLKEKKQTPWQTDSEEMWRKTPIRRLAKRMPTSTIDKREILLRAVMLDEYGERPGLLKPTPEGFEVADQAVAEPIEPSEDLSGPLQQSIDDVMAGRRGDKPPREPKKPPKEKPAEATKPPKAELDGRPSKIDDPYISTKQQTEFFNTAFQYGWKVEELQAYMLKAYKVKSTREIRASQYAGILEKVKSKSK